MSGEHTRELEDRLADELRLIEARMTEDGRTLFAEIARDAARHIEALLAENRKLREGTVYVVDRKMADMSAEVARLREALEVSARMLELEARVHRDAGRVNAAKALEGQAARARSALRSVQEGPEGKEAQS